MLIIFIFLLIILLIFSIKYPWWLPTKKGLIVLMYHHIYKYDDTCDLAKELYIEPEVFAKQIDFLLKHHYNPITLDELSKSYTNEKFNLPKKSVLITFDDGWLDNYTNAFTILKQKNVKANIFLACNYIEQKNCITWKQIQEMKSSGLISFGSHTFNHVNLSKLSKENILNELKLSKETIENKLSISIDFFAYPYGAGAFDKNIRNLIFESGYKFDFSTKRGITKFKWNKEKPICRLYIKQDMSILDFWLLITKGKNSF